MQIFGVGAEEAGDSLLLVSLYCSVFIQISRGTDPDCDLPNPDPEQYKYLGLVQRKPEVVCP